LVVVQSGFDLTGTRKQTFSIDGFCGIDVITATVDAINPLLATGFGFNLNFTLELMLLSTDVTFGPTYELIMTLGGINPVSYTLLSPTPETLSCP